MTHRDGRLRGDTLAALQAAQLQRERQLKESEKVAAARGVQSFWARNGWPEQDMYEVLAALGITKVETNDHGTGTGDGPGPDPGTPAGTGGPDLYGLPVNNRNRR